MHSSRSAQKKPGVGLKAILLKIYMTRWRSGHEVIIDAYESIQLQDSYVRIYRDEISL